MDSLLRDLYGHQAWADAECWRAFEAHPPARDDQEIRNRLHHLHLVQRTFTWAVGDRKTEFAFSKLEDFKSFDDLKVLLRKLTPNSTDSCPSSPTRDWPRKCRFRGSRILL